MIPTKKNKYKVFISFPLLRLFTTASSVVKSNNFLIKKNNIPLRTNIQNLLINNLSHGINYHEVTLTNRKIPWQ